MPNETTRQNVARAVDGEWLPLDTAPAVVTEHVPAVDVLAENILIVDADAIYAVRQLDGAPKEWCLIGRTT